MKQLDFKNVLALSGNLRSKVIKLSRFKLFLILMQPPLLPVRWIWLRKSLNKNLQLISN